MVWWRVSYSKLPVIDIDFFSSLGRATPNFCKIPTVKKKSSVCANPWPGHSLLPVKN